MRSRLRSIVSAALTVVVALICGHTALARPTISGMYPNGTNLFQAAAQLTFTAAAPAGVTNVSVQLTITPISTGPPRVNLAESQGPNGL